MVDHRVHLTDDHPPPLSRSMYFSLTLYRLYFCFVSLLVSVFWSFILCVRKLAFMDGMLMIEHDCLCEGLRKHQKHHTLGTMYPKCGDGVILGKLGEHLHNL